VNEPEHFRPRLHFSPRAGWINDPNGLIHVDGIWHMFFQHDPHSTVHGLMHWGHASSSDLVRWTEHPVALHPDALGACFSGSAIETPSGEIKLFYTAHSTNPDGSDHQVQCTVHANRSLTQFESDPSNPVIVNPGLAVFRDPKVIWHAPTACWIMVLTQGQSIGFYSSPDLAQWQHESNFGDGEGRHGTGPWECPDLVELRAPDGTNRWVLIVGIATDGPGGGSGTQYFVGRFDGHRFANDNPPETVLWMDHGRDFYAAQTFFGASEPTAIAWASNWQYARETPTQSFRGCMGLPRRLGLSTSPKGLRLTQEVPHLIARSFETVAPGNIPSTGTYRVAARFLPAEGPIAVTLFGEGEPQLIISRTGGGRTQFRTIRPATIGASFAHDYVVELDSDGSVELEVFVDNGLVEVNAGGGLWFTNLYFPSSPAGRVRVTSPASLTSELRPLSGT
jgi:fructan beta-fructosidase